MALSAYREKLMACLAITALGLSDRMSAAATIEVANVTQLENALAVAVTNRENDVINLAPVTYSLDSTLTYSALTNENKSLTIQCLDGGADINAGTISAGIMRGLYISTSGNVSHVTLDGLTIRNARLNGSEGSGAGLFAWVRRGSLTIRNCVFRNNVANQFLGAPVDCAGAWVRIDNTPGILTVRDSVFSNNYCSGTGGGLSMSIGGSTTGRVYNCLFVTNSAANQGGGAYLNVVGATLFVENNTLTRNWTGNGLGGGGGMHIRGYLNSDRTYLRNNIAWTNTSNTGLGTDIYAEDDNDGDGTGSFFEFFNNACGDFDIQDGDHLTSGSNTNGDPMLTSDFHLRSGSPCIDTGTNLAWMTGATDMDDQDRIFNGRVDMGYDEAAVAGKGLAATNGVTTAWDAVDEATYRLQYATNLLSPDWQDAGSTVTAAMRHVTAVDTGGVEAARVYRLQWTGP